MSAVEEPATPPRVAVWRAARLRRVIVSPRFGVYISSTLLAVLTSYLLGKDMQWDTLDYHLYDGFSAIHDRFGVDYFAAGVQSYFNAYLYAPFYLLVTSGLTALEVATILAVIHSGILWLSYELAIAIAPTNQTPARVAMALCATVLVFANPVLINQIGSSYADITTAELALAGCLLLMAFPAPGRWRIGGAGVLLGAATALKLSNGPMAASLAIVPFFLPLEWRKRLRYVGLLGLSTGLSFALVSGPWSIQLEQHFGNPFFPFMNGLFRSPQFTTGPDADSLFIPATLRGALWRPFAMTAPVGMVHTESQSPDLRYAILLVLAAATILRWLLRRLVSRRRRASGPRGGLECRALLALGCAFLVNWILWLSISGNSRYFLPMACVAAVLCIALLFRLFAQWPTLRNGLVAAALAAQIYQVSADAVFRPPLPWNEGPWFDVSVPAALASEPNLYFSMGIEANAFVIPFVAPGSGFINLQGGYVLGAEGANGARIRAMIRRFSPRLRMLIFDPRAEADRHTAVPYAADVDDALEPFGLRVDQSRCARIAARYAPLTFGAPVLRLPLSQSYTRTLVSCQVVADGAVFGAVPSSKRSADLVLDRLEVECPAVLEPRGSVTFLLSDRDNRKMWVRRYGNTHVSAWVSAGRLKFQAALGGDRAHDLGSVNEWKTASPRVVCGRMADGLFFLRVAVPRYR